jgi:hypothetical protein
MSMSHHENGFDRAAVVTQCTAVIVLLHRYIRTFVRQIMESDSIETRSHGRNERIGFNLHAPQQVQHPMPVLPDVRAKPDQVRDFISHLLIKRAVPEEHVRKVVRRWSMGSGREMRSYDPAMYLDIFGCEDGWIVYREVRLCIHEELCGNFTYKYQFGV